MRIKTSMYIDESVDAMCDKRAKDHKAPKSRTIEKDLENFFLCLEIGRKEASTSVSNELMQTFIQACRGLAGAKGKALFITNGTMPRQTPKAIKDLAISMSPLARLSILDTFEEDE